MGKANVAYRGSGCAGKGMGAIDLLAHPKWGHESVPLSRILGFAVEWLHDFGVQKDGAFREQGRPRPRS